MSIWLRNGSMRRSVCLLLKNWFLFYHLVVFKLKFCTFTEHFCPLSDDRRMLIEKIAQHLAEFTPRLRGNNRSTYMYFAIPAVQYPQLENELFCNIFYLRHLCDSTRFPDWPINEPVSVDLLLLIYPPLPNLTHIYSQPSLPVLLA